LRLVATQTVDCENRFLFAVIEHYFAVKEPFTLEYNFVLLNRKNNQNRKCFLFMKGRYHVMAYDPSYKSSPEVRLLLMLRCFITLTAQ
jgi:hypothetical protein